MAVSISQGTLQNRHISKRSKSDRLPSMPKKKRHRKVYFETSSYNFLLHQIHYEALLGTRELQAKRGRELLISPVTLWEIMLTMDDKESDFLLFSAQHLFSEKLLATPSEIMVRYLKYAYPQNIVNYSIYTDLEIRNIWKKMTHDGSVTFAYDKEKLKTKTQLIRAVSSKLPSIIEFPDTSIDDATLSNIANIVQTYYECLEHDGFIEVVGRESKRDLKTLFKLSVLIVLLFFVLKQDFDSDIIEEFWQQEGVSEDPTERMTYFFEKYPEIFRRGPILEVSIMAYHQLKLGRQNRGLILDSLHMIYAPYVDYIMTNDKDFSELRDKESHYSSKLVHVSELQFRILPYV